MKTLCFSFSKIKVIVVKVGLEIWEASCMDKYDLLKLVFL